MTRFLIFIRHSKVVKDPTIPSHTWQLSEDGRSLCLDRLPQLTSYQPTIFVTSTENKARETGQIMANALNVPWHDAPGLQEHDRTGVPYFGNVRAFETAVSTLFAHPDKLVFGQETANQAYTRFNHAVDAVMKNNPTGNIAIVAHGTILTLFITRNNPHIAPMPFWQTLKLPDIIITTWPDKKLVAK
ncbi:MAG: histidine phosphatase family protein [Chloroflexi bacterium]|nr:histidine phosphatase family protein [Chloroflexota bacterium]